MQQPLTVDDAELVRGALAGRREDFDALVERHQRSLYGFIYRFVHDHEHAADIMQVSFLQAYTHLGQFAGRASFKTWLYQIALNQCRAVHRTARAEAHVPLEQVADATVTAAAQAQAGQSAFDSDPDGAGWRPTLDRLIARLPLRQRAVVMLRVFSDLPFKEIARIEGISENSAKVNYHHAVVRLRQWMREDEP